MNIRNDKDRFLNILTLTAQKTLFNISLIEKDYYLTMFLSEIEKLSSDLVFKGGTDLNKIFWEYHRLSEDLDFIMLLPEGNMSRKMRSKLMDVVKNRIEVYAEQFDLKVINAKNAARNESKQYCFILEYDSIILERKERIALDISLRDNPLCAIEKKEIKHQFVNPITQKPLFNAGFIKTLTLKEILAEKFRAAATRKDIAPRDFYDLYFAICNGIEFANQEFINLFIEKLKEDGKDTNLSKYKNNLGRTDDEINQMKKRIQDELLPILTLPEQEKFNIDIALEHINAIMNKLC